MIEQGGGAGCGGKGEGVVIEQGGGAGWRGSCDRAGRGRRV